MIALDNLETLVDEWRREHGPGHDAHLEHFSSSRSLDEAIGRAARAEDGPNGKRNYHQRRLRRPLLAMVEQRLLSIRAEMTATTAFGDLIALIERTIRAPGIGPLMVYDTALRMGAFLNVPPDKVYLQAGSRIGAEVLFGEKLPRGARFPRCLDVSTFPDALERLRPDQIESFLCVMRKRL